MQKLTYTITRTLEIMLIVLMSAIVIDVTWQIFTRFILRDPSSFTEELAGFLLVWIGLLGASYALHTRAHLGIDILVAKLDGLKKQFAEVLVYSVVLLFALFILLIGGLKLVKLTYVLNQISPAIGIPMWYIYLALPLTGMLMMFYSLVFIVDALKKSSPSDGRPHVSPVN